MNGVFNGHGEALLGVGEGVGYGEGAKVGNAGASDCLPFGIPKLITGSTKIGASEAFKVVKGAGIGASEAFEVTGGTAGIGVSETFEVTGGHRDTRGK